MSRMPRTVNGYCPFECMSAVQKMIRRGDERTAMLFAVEMANTSKAYRTMIINRLVVTAYEDIGNESLDVISHVNGTVQILRENPGKCGDMLLFGSIIRALARAPKSREGDHFMQLCLIKWDEKGPGEIPDCALDKHTRRGKRMGRGVEHFWAEGAKLEGEQARNDYREEAERVVKAKRMAQHAERQQTTAKKTPQSEPKGPDQPGQLF